MKSQNNKNANNYECLLKKKKLYCPGSAHELTDTLILILIVTVNIRPEQV